MWIFFFWGCVSTGNTSYRFLKYCFEFISSVCKTVILDEQALVILWGGGGIRNFSKSQLFHRRKKEKVDFDNIQIVNRVKYTEYNMNNNRKEKFYVLSE